MKADSPTSELKSEPEPARDYFGTISNPSSPIKQTNSNSSISKRISRSNSSGLLAKIASRVSSHQTKDSISSNASGGGSDELALSNSPSQLKGSLSKSSKRTRGSTHEDPNGPPSPSSPKADLAALTRSNSKYKSGVKWDAIGFSQDDEPFMQSTLPADDSEAKRLEEEENAKRMLDETMLAQGSTAAAKAFAQRNSIGVGDPIFAGNYRMKLQEEEAKNRLKQEQFIRDQRNSIGMGSHFSTTSTSPRPSGTKPGMVMPMPSSPSSSSALNGSRGASPPSAPGNFPSTSSEAFPSNAQNGVLAEAAQRVLEAARRSAKGDVSQPAGNRDASASVTSHNTSISNHKTSTEASSSLRPSAASPSPPIEGSESFSHSLSPSPAPSIKGKRKSFFGTFRKSSTNLEEDLQNSSSGKKGKGKNSDGESVKSGGGGRNEKKGSRSRTPSESASKSPAASLSTTRENEEDGGTTTPGGTLGRRKYRDTRELHLVASELAAQALVGNEYPYASFAAAGQPHPNGSQSPNYPKSGTRTPSEGLTVGSGSNRRGPAAYSWGGPEAAPIAVGMNMPNGSASQTNLVSSPSHSGFLTPMTSNASIVGSAPTSPRFPTAELSPGGSPSLGTLSSSPGPRSRQGSFGYAIHATQTQQAKLNGLPQDMLTGLGDGPYPTLARRLEAAGLDMLDPFGIPTTHDRDSPFAASVRASNNGSASPGTSISSHHQQFSSGTSTPGGRRPMMTMSMSAPASELDYGLTKVGKGKQSRSASRNVTPQQSKEKLRDRAKKDAEKDGTGLVNAGSSKGSIPAVSSLSTTNPNSSHHPPSSAGAAVNAKSSNSLGLSKSISPPHQSTNSVKPPSSPVPSSSSSSSRQHQTSAPILGSPAPIAISRSPRSVSPNPPPSQLDSSKSSSSSTNLRSDLSKTDSNGQKSSTGEETKETKKPETSSLKPNASSSDLNGLLSTSASSKGLGRFSFFGKKKDQQGKENPIPPSPKMASPAAPTSPIAQAPVPQSDLSSSRLANNRVPSPSPSPAASPAASQSQASAKVVPPSQSQTQPQPQSEPQPQPPAVPATGMNSRPSDSSVASSSVASSSDNFRLPYLANTTSPEKQKPSALVAAAPMSSLGSQRQVAPPATNLPSPINSQFNAASAPAQREISRSRSREAMPAPQSTAPLQGNSNLGLPNGAHNDDARGRRISNISSASSAGSPNGVPPSSPSRPERPEERSRAQSRSPGRRPNGIVGANGSHPQTQQQQQQQQQQERNRVPSNAGSSFKGLPLGNKSSSSLTSNSKGSNTPRIPGSPSSTSVPAPSTTSSKLNPKNQEKEKSGGRFSKFVKSLTGSSDKDARNERSGTPSSITSTKSTKSLQIKPSQPQSPQSNKSQTMRGLGGGRQASLPPPSPKGPNGSQSLSSRPSNLSNSVRSVSGPGSTGPSSSAPSAPSPSRNLINRANPFQLANANPKGTHQSTSDVENAKAASPPSSGKSTPSFATATSLQTSPEIARQNLLTKEELERQARLADALGPLMNSSSISGGNNNSNSGISHSNSEADLKAAQAFVNQEMSSKGFGTSSAVYSSQNHPRSATLGIKPNGSSSNGRLSSSSNSISNNQSSDDLSPQISERSTSNGSRNGPNGGGDDASNSTNSTEDGLRTPGVHVPTNGPKLNNDSLVGVDGMGKSSNHQDSRVQAPQMI